jgi:hypothetical protein
MNAKQELLGKLDTLKRLYGADIICANITYTTPESYFTDDEDDVETPATPRCRRKKSYFNCSCKG